MPSRHVGLEVAPDDDHLEEWLGIKLDEATEVTEELINDFTEMVKIAMQDGEPYMWSYARLLNYLAHKTSVDMIQLLSYAIWRLMELEVNNGS